MAWQLQCPYGPSVLSAFFFFILSLWRREICSRIDLLMATRKRPELVVRILLLQLLALELDVEVGGDPCSRMAGLRLTIHLQRPKQSGLREEKQAMS